MEKGIEEGIEKGLEKGMEKGMEKGVVKGREEERLSIVLKMKSLNIPAKTIAEVTGLSVEEIGRA